MTRIFALESSARVGSVALFEDGRLIASEAFAHGLQNAARLLPLSDRLCRNCSLSPHEIDIVAVSIGPGSFTGLRIGVTLAKTLCYATGAKLIAVPSLEVIAANAPAEAHLVIPVLDARRGAVFAAAYRRERGGLVQQLPPTLLPPAELLTRLPRPLWLLGEGVSQCREHINAQVTILPEELWTPRAEVVGHLAIQQAARGEYADPFTLTPLYMRKPEAQERMEAGLLKHLENR